MNVLSRWNFWKALALMYEALEELFILSVWAPSRNSKESLQLRNNAYTVTQADSIIRRPVPIITMMKPGEKDCENDWSRVKKWRVPPSHNTRTVKIDRLQFPSSFANNLEVRCFCKNVQLAAGAKLNIIFVFIHLYSACQRVRDCHHSNRSLSPLGLTN